MNNKTIQLFNYDHTTPCIHYTLYYGNIILHYIGGEGGRQIIIVDKMQIYYTNNETNH